MPNHHLKGFGNPNITPERQREIASKGGKVAHQTGRAHEWTSEEAARYGSVGGKISKRPPGRKGDA